MTAQLQETDALTAVYLKVAERFLPAIKNRLHNDPLYKLVKGFGLNIAIDDIMREEITKFVQQNPLLADINASMMAVDLTAYLEKSKIQV